MEDILGFLLGFLQLFYPLLLASIITFIYALIKRSWKWMLVSGILLFPDAWYFSWYPPFPWAKFIPLIQVIIAFIFFRTKGKEKSK
ncbi:hypothetical protein [Robertmurraya kyonggiensis]|uniref:Uncharacterized protein n=1 Tax=Robertmurraya kyonggiensis TaxID=1037680 RepID=A0A4U1DA34_9BACI|nr:hypothetical protein [Robertmurraya kyonggiensis]TKC18883.1 hypothetical protein FA727_04835 [Robertmurraya kyonggiensis]